MKLGAMEIGIIVLIILIVFGVGRLPQIGSSLGKSIRAFKKESADTAEEPEPEPEPARKPRRKTAAKKKRTKVTVKADKAAKSEKGEPATSAS
jgi:sec-independent protein translocase protein TatA